ncbi:MAG: SDR family oxidoreductase [Alphaproteobacteria bacterium]
MGQAGHLFCFGYGYTCDYLGHALLEKGWKVSGTTRSLEKREELKSRGIHAHIFDQDKPLPDAYGLLDGVTHVLISTPPDDNGDTAYNWHGRELAGVPSIRWAGYLSTTGVYGDRNGEWVDETSELRPTSKRGTRRLEAENQWLGLHKNLDLPMHIFRLAGIYGPGRSALDSVRAGVARRINKPGHVFGRIHVEDIVQVVLASMAQPNAGSIYNVCDSNPAASHEVIAYACELLGRPVPPMIDFEEANLAPITRSFYLDNRRVRNTKIKEELGVALKYDDYKAGLEACRAAENFALTLFKKREESDGYSGGSGSSSSSSSSSGGSSGLF